MTGESLQVVFAYLDARRRRDIDSVSALLDEAVVHNGVLPELICRGRKQVLGLVRNSFSRDDFGIDRLELVGAGDHAVLGLAGPRFREIPDTPIDGQIFMVFTVRDGRIVRMQDYLRRADALRAAGVSVDAWD